MRKSVVLLSGGMDSLTCVGIASKESDEVAVLHLNYGHRTEKKELEAFNKIADFYNIKHRLVVDVNHLSAIGGSSLTDKNLEVEKVTNKNGLETEEIPSTYVPFRNANILAIATSWAEVLGFNALYVGAVAEDSAGYPDCRREFYDAFEKVIEWGTKPETNIKIYTPLITMQKSDIVEKGLELNVPFEFSWSCYTSNEEACGTCDSCVRRLRGFELAGSTDPIKYVGK